jgi:hypothetical protein
LFAHNCLSEEALGDRQTPFLHSIGRCLIIASDVMFDSSVECADGTAEAVGPLNGTKWSIPTEWLQFAEQLKFTNLSGTFSNSKLPSNEWCDRPNKNAMDEMSNRKPF